MISRHGSTFAHQAMNTVATSARLWREIMNISANSIKSGDDIVKRLNAEFGAGMVVGPGHRGSTKWNMDQILVSSQLHFWKTSRSALIRTSPAAEIHGRNKTLTTKALPRGH